MIKKMYFVALAPDPDLAVEDKMYNWENAHTACAKANEWAKRPVFKVYEADVSVKYNAAVFPNKNIQESKDPPVPASPETGVPVSLRDINKQLKKDSGYTDERKPLVNQSGKHQPAQKPDIPKRAGSTEGSMAEDAPAARLLTTRAKRSREDLFRDAPPQRRNYHQPRYSSHDNNFRNTGRQWQAPGDTPHNDTGTRYGRQH